MDKPADLDVATVMSMGFPATKVRFGSHGWRLTAAFELSMGRRPVSASDLRLCLPITITR